MLTSFERLGVSEGLLDGYHFIFWIHSFLDSSCTISEVCSVQFCGICLGKMIEVIRLQYR